MCKNYVAGGGNDKEAFLKTQGFADFKRTQQDLVIKEFLNTLMKSKDQGERIKS